MNQLYIIESELLFADDSNEALGIDEDRFWAKCRFDLSQVGHWYENEVARKKSPTREISIVTIEMKYGGFLTIRKTYDAFTELMNAYYAKQKTPDVMPGGWI